MIDNELIDQFRKLLIEDKKYPHESLIQNYLITTRFRADMLIVDRREFRPLALVNFKELPLDLAVKQIQKYLDELGKDIPSFVITVNDNGIDALSYDSKNKELVEIDFDQDFPDYLSLAVGSATAEAQRKIKKRDNSGKHLKIACYGLAVALVIMFGLAKAKLIDITSDDLFILVTIVALCLAPYAAEIKLMGIEYKAKSPKGENEDK